MHACARTRSISLSPDGELFSYKSAHTKGIDSLVGLARLPQLHAFLEHLAHLSAPGYRSLCSSHLVLSLWLWNDPRWLHLADGLYIFLYFKCFCSESFAFVRLRLVMSWGSAATWGVYRSKVRRGAASPIPSPLDQSQLHRQHSAFHGGACSE